MLTRQKSDARPGADPRQQVDEFSNPRASLDNMRLARRTIAQASARSAIDGNHQNRLQISNPRGHDGNSYSRRTSAMATNSLSTLNPRKGVHHVGDKKAGKLNRANKAVDMGDSAGGVPTRSNVPVGNANRTAPNRNSRGHGAGVEGGGFVIYGGHKSFKGEGAKKFQTRSQARNFTVHTPSAATLIDVRQKRLTLQKSLASKKMTPPNQPTRLEMSQ